MCRERGSELVCSQAYSQAESSEASLSTLQHSYPGSNGVEREDGAARHVRILRILRLMTNSRIGHERNMVGAGMITD